MPKFKQNPLIEEFVKKHPEFAEKVNDLLDAADEYTVGKTAKKETTDKQADALISMFEAIGATVLESLFGNKTTENKAADEGNKEDSATGDDTVTGYKTAGYGCPDEAECGDCIFNGKCDLQEDKCHCYSGEDKDDNSCDNAEALPDIDDLEDYNDEDMPDPFEALYDAMDQNCLEYLSDVISDKVSFILSKFAVDGYVDDSNGSVYPYILNTDKHTSQWILKFKTNFDFSRLLSNKDIQTLNNNIRTFFNKSLELTAYKVIFSATNISIIFGKED